MRTLTRSLSVAVFIALIAALPVPAEDANQLYEFKFKDPKDDGYFDTLQEKYVWFRAKKGFHLFDAYTGEQKWSHKELPDFDGNYTLLVDEKYLLYSTKKRVARLDIETGNIDWSTELSKLKFKDVDRRWWTDHGYIFQIKNNFTLLDVESGKEQWWVPLKPSSDLGNKRGLQWFFDLGDRFLFLAKDGPVLIDASTGETLLSIKDKYNKKVDPVVLLDNQLMFFFDKRIALVDLESATETISIEGKVEGSQLLPEVRDGWQDLRFLRLKQAVDRLRRRQRTETVGNSRGVGGGFGALAASRTDVGQRPYRHLALRQVWQRCRYLAQDVQL